MHVRSASPKVAWPCFYGIDTADQDQLVAAKMSTEEICEYIGADSLGFLSIEGLLACVPSRGYCESCFSGRYPVAIPEDFHGRFLPENTPDNLNPSFALKFDQVEQQLIDEGLMPSEQ